MFPQISPAVKGWYDDEKFKKYEPYIVANKKNKKKLFCTLTRISLNKIPEEVEKHVAGKKFQRLRKEAQKNTTTTAEPSSNKESNGNDKTSGESSFIAGLEKNLASAIESDEEISTSG